MWILLRLALSNADAADFISISFALASPATTTFTSSEIRFTASNCSGEETGNPASMISTFIFSNCRAISIFSCIFNEAPGDCSPSRKVVSNTNILSDIIFPRFHYGLTRNFKTLLTSHG